MDPLETAPHLAREHGSSDVIVTSYTSLVVDAHRAQCSGLIQDVVGLLRRNAPIRETKSPVRTYEPLVVRLAQPIEVTESTVVIPVKVSSAA